jgi:hypothetical protein
MTRHWHNPCDDATASAEWTAISGPPGNFSHHTDARRSGARGGKIIGKASPTTPVAGIMSPYSPVVDVGSSIFVGGWYNFQTLPGSGPNTVFILLLKRVVPTIQFHAQLSINSSGAIALWWDHNVGGSQDAYSAGISTDEWHYYQVELRRGGDNAAYAKLYLDGVERISMGPYAGVNNETIMGTVGPGYFGIFNSANDVVAYIEQVKCGDTFVETSKFEKGWAYHGTLMRNG